MSVGLLIDEMISPEFLFRVSFALGALPLARWTILIAPVLVVVGMADSAMNAGAIGDDPAGLYVFWGAIFVAACLAFWLIARGAALLGRRLHAKRRAADRAGPF